ncbi:MAG: BatA domain-containing protein [Planctomycetes bacterium]|nr:BatA domain-containing protein [Planctomycetota bacterium]
MHFLEPYGLLGLAALIPIVALYFLKLRREERVVPSTLLWKKVIEDMHVNAPFQRLRYSLLLLLQLLMVALLGFALARPYLAMSGSETQRIILLIDTSASMSTRDAGPDGTLTRLEAALRDAKKKVDDLGNNGEMRIVAFDEEVRQLTRFTQDRYTLKETLDQLKPRHLRTHAQEAFETCMSLAEERENTKVVVLSDGCFGKLDLQKLLGAEAANVNTENQPVSKFRNRFQFVDYGKQDTDNVAITGMSARTRPVSTKDENGNRVDALETQVFVMVENFSAKDQDVILSLATDQATFTPKVIKLKARARNEQGVFDDAPTGATVDASRSNEVFKLPLGTAGVVTARIQAPKDAFPLDDEAQVVVGSSEGTKILFVSKGNYFIEKAFLAMRGFEVMKISPEEFEKSWTAKGALAVDGYDCVVFESCAPPKWEDGGAVIIGAMPPITGFKAKEPPKLEGPPIISWDDTHPVMRYINFGNVTVLKALAWQIPKIATSLVDTQSGSLLMAYENDRVHVVGIAFEVFDSDWPLRRSMPLFLKNAINWAAEASSRRRPVAQKTGEPLIIPPIADGTTAKLTRPDGSTEEVKISSEQKTPVKEINTVGLYMVTDLPGGKASDRVYAVNLADPQESDNGARVKIKVGDQDLEASPAAISAKSEIWRWLALAAVTLLMAEWWVYHRRIGL